MGLSGKMHQPHTTHLQAVKRIFRFVKGTQFTSTILSGHYLTCLLQKLIGQVVPTITVRQRVPVYWSQLVAKAVKKQSTTSRSSCEAQYWALATTAAKLHYIILHCPVHKNEKTCLDSLVFIDIRYSPY